MTTRLLPAASVLALCLSVAAAYAQAPQYRWIDEKGRVQYTDTPPPASAKNVQKKNLNMPKGEGPGETFALQNAKKGAPVKLYTGPNCEFCDIARTFLNKRGIPFTEISVVKDSELAELRAVSGRSSVPVMIIGRQMERGFGEANYDQALDAAGYPKRGTLPERNQEAPVSPPAAAKSSAPAKAAAPPAR